MIRPPLIPLGTWITPVTPPPLKTHPKKIRVLIKKLRTPQQVQYWINSLEYNPRDTMTSLRWTHHHRRAHCLEAALAAATILEYHGPAQHGRKVPRAGHPPLILDLQSADPLDHTLFLYRQAGRFGTIGISRDVGLAGRRPVYKTLLALVQSYAAPFIDRKAKITGYGVLDLRTLRRQDWRTAKKNLWSVERALDDAPHRRFRSSPTFIRYWRQRHLSFKKQHPHEQPDFYPHRRHWA